MAYEMRINDWSSDVCSSDLYFVGLNNYYLAQEHGDLAGAFSAPPNVLDNFTLNSTAELEKRAGQAEQRAVQAESQFAQAAERAARSEEHTSELQSIMRLSYAVCCLKTKSQQYTSHNPCHSQEP